MFPELLALVSLLAPQGNPTYAQEHYSKREVRIPMRDGVTLHAAIYTPDEPKGELPMLLNRTPYSVGPYGEGAERERLGPSELFEQAGYIFVYQDVRGCFQSEGEFVNMRPHVPVKRGPADIDESSDTYDTIAWLVANVPGNNGRVGQWGISYPGFYSAAGMIDAHPALVAVSPQAPIADWFYDDFRHHGALWLPHAFNFLSGFGRVRTGLTSSWPSERFQHGTQDGYAFFLALGPLANGDQRHFKGTIPYWNELLAHADYDDYWQARNLRPHLNHVAPAVLTVGGWFDAEDLFGPLKIYREVEQRNPGVWNGLVMGPWAHGGWARGDGDRLGHQFFGAKQSLWYRENVEFPFFEQHLRGGADAKLAEATVFDTGTNEWKRHEHWPPRNVELLPIFAREGFTLAFEPPRDGGGDAWVSDPAKPVPFTSDIAIGMTREYMSEDQRFAARRPDVLTYLTEPLTADLTLAGPILAELWVTTTGTDADFVVKLLDVQPGETPDWDGLAAGQHAGDAMLMVRSEAIRGRYRRSYVRPEPFVPGQPALVDVELLDVLHTFKQGHRLALQIQSTWFPLMDRNPQTYVPNVAYAAPADFVAHTHTLLRSPEHPTRFVLGVLR